MTFFQLGGKALRATAIAAAFLFTFALASLHAQDSSSEERQLVANPEPSTTPAMGPSAQESGHTVPAYGYPQGSGLKSHLAMEFGGGWTTPASEDQHDLTYGWDVVLGGGYKVNRHFTMMGEYQYNYNNIPAKVLQQVGEPGGHISIWSLTADPVWHIKTGGMWGAYAVGGGGYYKKTTSFTQPAIITSYYCDYFYCYPYQYYGSVVVAQFSDNAGGMNIGGGLTFGSFEGAKFYSEARYTWIATPGQSTKFVPVTFGVRW